MKAKLHIGHIVILVLSLFVIAPLRIHGQENKEQYYNWFDQTIGPVNSGIYTGIEYQENYRGNTEQHKFFLKPNFTVGQLVYDGQPFFNVDLLYDVFDDQLLVRYMGLNGSVNVQLIKNRIESFDIAGHHFVNIRPNVMQEDKLSGFYEVLFTGKWSILHKKHLKKILKKSDKEVIYYSFKDKEVYYIEHEGIFEEISSIRDLMNVFPEEKKALLQINEHHKKLRKSDPEQYFIEILKDLERDRYLTQNKKEP